MIKSGFFNVCAAIVIILGILAGMIAEVSAESWLIAIIVWGGAFVVAVTLYYLGASLFHLEQINKNTSILLRLESSAQKDTSSSLEQQDQPDKCEELSENRCLLCGKKYTPTSNDSGLCSTCQENIK